MEYSNYTQEEAAIDGIGFVVSKYSTKLVDNGKVVGTIVFEDTPLTIDKAFIEECANEDAKTYYKNLNNAKSIHLRKLTFNGDRHSGKLEDFFDYVTTKIVPHDFIIWCTLQLKLGDFESYITQIGGFNKPLHDIPNKYIRIFSIDL